MPEQQLQTVLLPGGQVVEIPVIPGDQTPTWTYIVLALMAAKPAEARKPAEEQ